MKTSIYCFFITSLVISSLYYIFPSKFYKIKPLKAVIFGAALIPFSYYLVLIEGWVESGFSVWGSYNSVRGFAFFPLIIIPLGKIFRIRSGVALDMVASNLILCHAIGKLGCMFSGCCQGFPSSWGLWNPVTDSILFPIQPLESIVAFIIFAFLLWYAKKNCYKGDGSVYALFLITFGFTRFFLEFLRDNKKVFGNISNLALYALLAAVVGLIWLWCIKDKEARAAPKKVLPFPPMFCYNLIISVAVSAV